MASVQIAATMLSGNSLRQTVHTHCASVHQTAKLAAALLRVAGVTVGLEESNGSLPRVYNSHHLQADCQEPGSAPEPYAWYMSMGYLYLFISTLYSIKCMVVYCCYASAALPMGRQRHYVFQLSIWHISGISCMQLET